MADTEQLEDDERLEIECLNVSILRSVQEQNSFLDKAEGNRRVSISSMCSTLTELSSCCSENIAQTTPFPESAMPPAQILPTATNAVKISTGTRWIANVASNLCLVPFSTRRSTTVDAADQPPKEGPSSAQKSAKRPRRRQKKKKGPVDGEVEVVQVEHRHQKERMQKFKKLKAAEKSKKTRMESARSIKVLNGVTPIPFELGQFRPSLKVVHESRVYRHGELEALGIRTIPWDGHKTLPITTPSGYIIALLAGRPASSTWDDCMVSLAGIMNLTRDAMRFDDKEAKHRRGTYASVNTGISYGGGAKAPGELGIGSQRRTLAVDALKRCRPFKALSGYISKAFERNAVQLYTFCTRTLELIESDRPHLRRLFKNSPFGSTTFNFGPQVCTVPHKDLKNLSWGWCAVTSLGAYDHTKGGHLVLWDLKIAVEFPPHSTIFIPSAIIEHSSAAIRPTETRMSITSYNCAGLFWWIAYGFMPM